MTLRSTGPLPEPPEQLLTTEQLAAYLVVPRQTLYDWRVRGEGPRGLRVGKHLRYRRADVEAWLDARYDAA